MKAWHLALIGLLFSCCLAQSVQAGPLLDRLRERRAGSASASGNSLPPDVQRLSNLAYGSDPAQRLDVYLPANAHQAPVIFMVHGGAWAVGDKAMGRVVEAKVARWVGRGFIFVSTNYRMLPDAPPDVQLRDVQRALAFAQGKAGEWGGDAQRFILMGHSAGAHLVALLAASPAAARQAGLQAPVATVALDSAAMNLVEIMSQPHYRLYDKPFGDDPVYWQRMSPTLNLGPGAPPFLLVCSSRREASCQQARQFAERAGAQGIRAEVLSQDLSHGDINSQLGLPGRYTDAVEDFMASLDRQLERLLR
ncbi:MAG: alpha/beta hydrolase [Rhodocyclales bacterium GT-UBC]|nr:MAG: alpha/beta hydrolase [Rhodocyclales bacterium GT-UBC]